MAKTTHSSTEKATQAAEQEFMKTSKSFLTSLRAVSFNNVLVAVIIVMSFFLGSFYTKAQFLEKGGTIPTTGTVANAGTTGTVGAGAVPAASTAPAAPVNVDVGHLPLKGDPNAKVTLIQFEDFRCPFCERYFTQVESQIMKDYVDTGKVKIAYRHYAFLGDASVTAANASECANEQGKFWEYHDWLFQNQPDESDTSMYTSDKLSAAAGTLGMNAVNFKSCLDAKKYDKNVSDDLAAGTAAGVDGTPSFFINGTPIVGAQPYTEFQKVIDAALQAS